jgi:hypothetical protein
MSSALASLGDAMFGYGQGSIASAQVQPSFIYRMFGKEVTMAQIQAGQTGVDPITQGLTLFFSSSGHSNNPVVSYNCFLFKPNSAASFIHCCLPL